MLKGHVFNLQKFGVQVFARFIDTFLAGAVGIDEDYANGMALSYSNKSISIDKGICVVKGRYIEEDSGTTVTNTNSNAYCLLVLEIDLDQTNTLTECNQISYKILSSTTAYPTATTEDISGQNSGVYQFELAKFKTGSNAEITEFIDTRRFIDFTSVSEAEKEMYQSTLDELVEELQEARDESLFIPRTEYINKVNELNAKISDLTETVLYSDSTGTTGNVNLNDEITNYKRIKIFYYRHANDHNSVEIETKLDRMVDLKTAFIAESGAVYQMGIKRVILKSTFIKKDYEFHINFSNNKTIIEYGSQNLIYIYKVVGYKA